MGRESSNKESIKGKADRLINAAIFDLDGTLMDSEVLWVEGLCRYLRGKGIDAPYEKILSIVYGRAWNQVYSDAQSTFALKGVDMETMEHGLRREIEALQDERGDVIIHSSVALLKRLAQSMPVCIVSGAPEADIYRGIVQMGIADEVRFYIGAEQYQQGKPDPTCFLMAQQRLGIPAAECVVFEDSNAGVIAAKRAGMRCVALARPGLPPQDLSMADRVVEDLESFDLMNL